MNEESKVRQAVAELITDGAQTTESVDNILMGLANLAINMAVHDELEQVSTDTAARWVLQAMPGSTPLSDHAPALAVTDPILILSLGEKAHILVTSDNLLRFRSPELLTHFIARFFRAIKLDGPTVVQLVVASLSHAGLRPAWAQWAEVEPGLTEYLLSLLSEGDDETRQDATIALGFIADPRTVGTLCNLAETESEPLRRAAITALGGIRHQHALRTLLNALHTDAVEEAAEALARIGEEAVKPLIQKLTDTDPTTRLYAARSLGEIRDQRGVEPLLELLSDEDVLVRVHAALALGEIGDSRAVEPLILLLGDSDANVRYSTSFALADLGDDRAVAPLIRTLRDNDESVRWSAARNLAALRDPRALESLIEALEDPGANVRYWAIVGLSQLGGQRALASLARMRESDSGVARNTMRGPFSPVLREAAESAIKVILGHDDWRWTGQLEE